MTSLGNFPDVWPPPLWAKLKRDKSDSIVGWHSLVDHSADVAAVVKALLEQPIIRRRLAAAAGREDLDPVTCARLAALAFLHDIGKANRGFRARVDPSVDRGRPHRVGHIDQLAWVFKKDPRAEQICDRLMEVLGFARMDAWFAEKSFPLFDALFAHHGKPWNRDNPPDAHAYWARQVGSDPVGDLAPMRDALDRWFKKAFKQGPRLPEAPAFHHAFAGLLMLADWLGSDEGFFPYAHGRCADRMAFARPKALDAVKAVGLDAAASRAVIAGRSPSFFDAFGFGPARPIQEQVAEPDANVVVLEAETGSGKTEAALWRFAHLFRKGLVDGLYFALPTRVAATQIFERVRRFRDRVFPNPDRPAVVLAVPGQLRVDEAEGRRLPGFEVQWSDDPADAGRRRERWAAEHPKRYLAAQIAVGTIDQALLGAIRVKHAHLRGTALLRHLLVVDEIHASDRYMEALLGNLLKGHTAAGGHALLLSATLGAGMRARLLGTPVPLLPKAKAIDYPALTWAEGGRERQRPIRTEGEPKRVAVEPQPLIDDPVTVAALALDAARQGAKVLVVRNTVGAAVETMRRLEEQAGAASPHLFRAEGIATLHHSRFSPDDRRLLDAAVERAVGRERGSGGLVVVGTQTLEISLDLDVDLLVADLCPVDVLLQRIGRLHRHGSPDRIRPNGFEEPRAIVLISRERDLAPLAVRGRHGLGAYVYDDLRVIEATLRLIETEPLWAIPAMNRRLVEEATHPDRLAAIEAELSERNPAWRSHFNTGHGQLAEHLNAAKAAVLRRDRSFEEFRIDPDETIASRLGARDRLATFGTPPMGPFGRPVTSLRVPSHWLDGVGEEDEPEQVVDNPDGLSFRLGAAVFSYGRFGLARADGP